MRRILSILSGILLLGAIIAPATVVADITKCGGTKGVDIWQDGNAGGPTMRLCWTFGGYANLSNQTTNLNWGANWNDRISSYQTFNNAGHSFRFYADANFVSTSVGGRVVTTTGNQYVPFIGVYWEQQIPNGFNDRVTSIKWLP